MPQVPDSDLYDALKRRLAGQGPASGMPSFVAVAAFVSNSAGKG
jgi:hypothetical protein